MPADIPARHHLVWLRDDAWRTGFAQEPPPEHSEIARAWFAAGRPAVVRRSDGSLPPDSISLGIPLPPSRGKLRIALTVCRDAVREIQPPLLLSEAISSAPDHWRAPLMRLIKDAAAINLSFRVYGSLAWQHLTQEIYMTENSDVDLLWKADSGEQLQRGLSLLRDWEETTGLRADGELLIGEGSAVAWRELLQPANKILVKSLGAIDLRPVAEVLGVSGAKINRRYTPINADKTSDSSAFIGVNRRFNGF